MNRKLIQRRTYTDSFVGLPYAIKMAENYGGIRPISKEELEQYSCHCKSPEELIELYGDKFLDR